MGNMKTGEAGIELMHQFEGFAKLRKDGRVEAYPDPGTGGEPWTIGWGTTGEDPFNGGRIKKGTIWTREQADERFRQHLAKFESAVNKLVKVSINQNQFDALVSFTYNVGIGSLTNSTLLRVINRGNFSQAEAQFLRWNRAGGKVMAGLTRRRQAEADLFNSK